MAHASYDMSEGAANGKSFGPTIFFSKKGEASFTQNNISLYNAIPGNNLIVTNWVVEDGLVDSYPAPRTVIGLDKTGTRLILFVADGRQPLFSQGASLHDMAKSMIFYSAQNAMNVEGGGSLTLVMCNSLGIARVINSSIQTGIPGRERLVGNHLGIFAQH